MELQFEKNTLPCLQQVLYDTQTTELTQELRLPEGMPDIGQVVSCWAQPVIRGKEWRSDRVSVSGGVMCWVLYTPEEGAPQSMAAWLPYQMKWDIPQTRHDGTIVAQPFLHGADARSLSSRKLMLRVGLGMQVQSMTPGECSIYAPGELPPDVQVKKRVYPMLLPVEAGEKVFQIEEDISLPGNLPAPKQLVRYSFHPSLSEWKMMADKVVFRGTGHLHILYLDENSQLHTWDYELPISQFADLDREYDTDATADMVPAVTNLELDLLDNQLRLKAGLTGQYVVYERPMVELVQDAYSPIRTVEPMWEDVVIPAVLDRLENTMRVEQSVDTGGGDILDIAFYPDAPQQRSCQEGVQIQLPGVFQLLGQNSQGQLESTNAYWEESEDIPVSQSSRVQSRMLPVGVPQAMANSSGVSMQADIAACHQIVNGAQMPAVAGLALGEELPKDPQRPSLILRRAGQESLWDIAKAAGTTQEAICKANHLENEPSPSQMLIIPIP